MAQSTTTGNPAGKAADNKAATAAAGTKATGSGPQSGSSTSEPNGAGFKLPDPATVGRSMADIAERSQRIVNEWLKRQGRQEQELDPLNIGSAFMEMTARLMAN